MSQSDKGVRIERDDFGHSEVLDEQAIPGVSNQSDSVSEADRAQVGGNSGGYGKGENQQHHQGTDTGSESEASLSRAGQRGEQFDEEQGGGRA